MVESEFFKVLSFVVEEFAGQKKKWQIKPCD